MPAKFRLNSDLNPDALRERFRKAGRIHIPDFLVEEDAWRLHESLRRSDAWRLIVNQEDKLFELDRAAQAQLTPEAKRQLELAVHVKARAGFQYWYESIRVPDDATERSRQSTELVAFAQFLGSETVLSVMRKITGDPQVKFADAQATAYGPGHFLTVHTDDVSGKDRSAAYVYNLTPQWHIDWGGLLMFHGQHGHVEEAYSPVFNALNLFTVPQHHSVSIVAPFAAFRRYSVTGWLRRCDPPGALKGRSGPGPTVE